MNSFTRRALHLLEAAKSSGIERFILALSSSVYGASKVVPFPEDQLIAQTLRPFAATKIAGEYLCPNFCHLYKIRSTCLRFFTVYGPRGRPDLAIHKFTDLIYHDKPIDLYGNGTARRDFTYIDDIIQGDALPFGVTVEAELPLSPPPGHHPWVHSGACSLY